MITEEHQSRAMSPLGYYYFYFDHEKVLKKLCGIKLPSKFESETNHLRISFTTNSLINGKGFKLQWKAVCGTINKMSHGVIMSPHYPNFYPNENMVCEYLINPEANVETKILTLKVLDFDLDNSIVSIQRTCSSDYIEIRNINSNIVESIVCGFTSNYESYKLPTLSIKVIKL